MAIIRTIYNFNKSRMIVVNAKVTYNNEVKFLLPIKLFLLFIPLLASVAYAKTYSAEQTEWKQCAVNTHQNSSKPPKITNQPYPDAIYLSADEGTIRTEGITKLYGNIIIQSNDIQFNANEASFNRADNIVNAQGNVVLSSPNSILKSQSIQYNLKKQTGIIKNAEYEVGTEGAHGKSQQIEQIDKNNLQLSEATYTSCPVSVDSWHFSASKIELDKETQIGSAKNVTLKIGETPIFYFPWLNFPLSNQRLSGFLSPQIRLQTNAGISLPYYLNLAPNYDATITLSTLKHRGLKFDTEFRYLTERHQGTIKYDLLPDDSSSNNKLRDYFAIKHDTKLDKHTKIRLVAEGVSDKDYFNDFSTSLEDSTRSSLQRRLEITRNQGDWLVSAAVEDYQILDIKDAPYARLPEIKLRYHPKEKFKEFDVGLDSELVYFDKDNATTGTRADIKVFVSRKWGDDSWFIKPKLSLQHTSYSLNSSKKRLINRTLPIFTLDSGLFFDRKITLKNKQYTQTLEPRLFYTKTPYKDQSNIPIFDTAKINFSATNQLFSENRFTGKDRIADTNQLTFAVTSRIQDPNSGIELFKASIGQSFSFSDKKVTLPNGTIQTGRLSNLVLELSGRVNEKLRASAVAVLNKDKRKIPNYELRLNYHDDKKRIANVSYRKLDTELKQLSFSGAMPITEKWSMVASIDQDVENNRNLQTLLGFEYQDCCWKTRIVAKRYLTADNKNYETPVFIEFELKGLGSLGTGASREIKDNIYGYDDY